MKKKPVDPQDIYALTLILACLVLIAAHRDDGKVTALMAALSGYLLRGQSSK